MPIFLTWHSNKLHPITKQIKGEVNDGWDCDARDYFGKCFCGITGFD